MSGSIICPNCGAKNPSSNRFCEDCGYDLNKAPASGSASPSALFCPNGHSVSETGLSMGFCDVCGEKLVSEMSAAKSIEPLFDPEPVEPQPPTPASGKKCPVCGAVNPETGMFCEECGQSLAEAPVPPVHGEPVVVSPSHHAKEPLPDIPDIMRTMTNEDMKR